MELREGWVLGYHTTKSDKRFVVSTDGGDTVLAEYPPTLFPFVVDASAVKTEADDAKCNVDTPDGRITTTGLAALFNIWRKNRVIEGFRGTMRQRLLKGETIPGAWVADQASGLYTPADVERAGTAKITASAEKVRKLKGAALEEYLTSLGIVMTE